MFNKLELPPKTYNKPSYATTPVIKKNDENLLIFVDFLKN